MKFLGCTAITVISVGLAAMLPASATTIYDVTDLGALSIYGGTAARGINNAGQITGYSFTGFSLHAFVYSNGVMRDLGTPTPNRGGLTVGNGLNDVGQVTGEYSREDVSSQRHTEDMV